jgi:xylan 1,4-beta-xylosidase
MAGLPVAANGARVAHYRIDETHSNAYGAWRRMGSPIAPNEKQYADLIEASKLASIDEAGAIKVSAGRGELRFALPRQGVSLLVLDWGAAR